MEARFKYFVTERHGYVQTTIAYLRKLRISKLISPYSRRQGNKVYIEEDGDLRLFAKRHTVEGITFILEEDYSKPQRLFDNMFNHRDLECEDQQFDGFMAEWSLLQRVYFRKPDCIKHINECTFKTEDGKKLELRPAFYIDGKLLNDKQLKKLGLEFSWVKFSEIDLECID
jgi:hypothetical protein